MSHFPRHPRHRALPVARASSTGSAEPVHTAAPWPLPASALVLVAVVLTVLSACGQGSSGSGIPLAGPGASSAPAQVPAALLHAPLDCPQGTPVLILQRVTVPLAHGGTVVVARCDSGAGSPPSGVYVISGDGPTARVTATLVHVAEDVQVSSVETTPSGLRVTGLGYSTPDIPRCCPDRELTLDWRIEGGRLVGVS